ncbi:MAG: chemotaxis protein methyltransferase CheR [Solirubrobacteraceae bacterium]|nr:chemotaxis protein methyltransferase CheR [Solirubrobacteraceae bacterium]
MKISLSPEEYDALRAVLARAAGLVFDETRKESMAYSVAERMRAAGLRDVSAYLSRLEDPVERQHLLDEVTIQETHFFRNPPQIRALRLHVLPELLRHAEANGRRLRIWSAGCSTGEEPYTIAMLLRELLPTASGWDVKVVATDVSSRAIAAARTGRYGTRAVQLASPEELGRHFQAAPDGGYEVRPEVRELVEFRHHNLVTEPAPFAAAERIDLVLCRNVTIYFGRETTRALMARLHHVLRDGGYLFLGHSETLWQVSEDFRLVALGTGDSAAFVYRRLDLPAERRAVLPDRRTADEGPPPPKDERRRQGRRQEPDDAPLLVGLDTLVEQAGAALAAGFYAEAAQLAADACVLAPLGAAAFYLRGLALVNLGRDEDALVELRKAVYLEPDRGFAHFLLAGVLDRLGQPVLAARAYAAAADTLGSQPSDLTAAELGGRSVRELAHLCRQLEQRLVGDGLAQVVEEVS